MVNYLSPLFNVCEILQPFRKLNLDRELRESELREVIESWRHNSSITEIPLALAHEV